MAEVIIIVVTAILMAGMFALVRGIARLPRMRVVGPPPSIADAVTSTEVYLAVPAKLAIPEGGALRVGLRFTVVYRPSHGSRSPFGLVVTLRGGRDLGPQLDYERLLGIDSVPTGKRPVGGKDLPRWGKRNGGERTELAILGDLPAGRRGTLELVVATSDGTTLVQATAFTVAPDAPPTT
jgi:hypothetical protein